MEILERIIEKDLVISKICSTFAPKLNEREKVMKTKTYALVRVHQMRDNSIDEMELIGLSTDKEEFEQKIAGIYDEVINKASDYSVLVIAKDGIKVRNETWKTTTTYKIVEEK